MWDLELGPEGGLASTRLLLDENTLVDGRL